MFIFAPQRLNTFLTLLKELRINTTSYSNEIYQNHPYRNTMFGLADILSDYKINNAGVRFNNKKEALESLEVPFVAHAGGDMVVVTKITETEVFKIWRGQTIKLPKDDFIKTWSGATLLVETNEDSSEPDYKINEKKQRFNRIQEIFLFIALIAFVLYAFNNIGGFNHFGLSVQLLLNFVGLYIGYLLVMRQLNIQNSYADKICSLFKKSDCNDVLSSSAAKFMGVVGWSEVGLGYFTSNLFVILFAPHLICYFALINVIALPYTFWSVWYQKFRAKQWCPLCLIVQALLWGIFLINFGFGFIGIPYFNPSEVLLTACLYLIPYLIVSLLLPRLGEAHKARDMSYEINSLKMKDEVFKALLKNQPYYPVTKDSSAILLGNPDAADLITIVTNPHCQPCALMHKRIGALLEKAPEKICVQYIFTSFSEDLKTSAKFLAAVYLSKPRQEAEDIYNAWFDGEKHQKEKFWAKYGLDLDAAPVCKEMDKHKEWLGKTDISATPTVLLNGYKFPEIYKIEDIKLFSNLTVDVK